MITIKALVCLYQSSMNNLEIIAQVLFSYYELRANTKYNQLYIFIFSDFSLIKYDSNESLSHNNSTQNDFRQTRPCKTSTGKRYHENPHAKKKQIYHQQITFRVKLTV